MNTYKIQNTTFNVDRLAFKTKPEFIAIYKTHMTAANLEEAWKELKQYIKEK